MSKENWFPVEYQGIKYPSFEASNLGNIAKIENGKRQLICTDKSKRRNVYIKNKIKGVRVAAARVLYCSLHKVEIPKGMVVDHIDNNFLNDRIENFQLITNSENIKKYHAWQRGIEKEDPFKDWVKPRGAILRENNLYKGRVIHLGRYPTKKQADTATDIAKAIITIYKVRNNDNVSSVIIEAITEYRESIGVYPVNRYSTSSTKKTEISPYWDYRYKYVYN